MCETTLLRILFFLHGNQKMAEIHIVHMRSSVKFAARSSGSKSTAFPSIFTRSPEGREEGRREIQRSKLDRITPIFAPPALLRRQEHKGSHTLYCTRPVNEPRVSLTHSQERDATKQEERKNDGERITQSKGIAPTPYSTPLSASSRLRVKQKSRTK